MKLITIHAIEQPLVVGSSRGITQVLDMCHKVAATVEPVFFQGEVGTGKHLLATYVHRESSQSQKPLFVINCADASGIVNTILNFNEQHYDWEFLKGGTIYFDEVAALDLEQQEKLFEFCLFAKKSNIRVFLSSSQNIHMLLFDKAFHKELYEMGTRLEILVPPLRQRTEDIPQLVDFFLQRLNLKLRKSIQGLTPQVEEVFLNYRWPQNIDELQYVLTRAAIIANEPYIGQRHLTDSLGQMGHEQLATYDVMPLERMEEILLRSALNRYGYTLEGKKRAARSLNISLATLYNKLKRYNLNA